MIIKTAALLVPIFLFSLAAPLGAATEAEQTFLNLYFSPEELHVVSTTRSLKSVNRIAENVQVISAADIALTQAHSLAEVLEMVTGIAIENHGGPGGPFMPSIQGSSFAQIAAFLDGLPLNNLSDNYPELTLLPVEEIARIEVIKGPASSAWGSALGGVINIVTKNPPGQPGHAGSVSASAGKAETTDLRAQVAGSTGTFGYAVTAGRFRSDSLAAGYQVARSSVTTKLAYRPNPSWNLGFTLYYTGSDRGEGLYPEYDEVDRSEADHLRAQFTSEAFLASGLLSFNLWGAQNDDALIFNRISDGAEFYRGPSSNNMGGAGLRYRRSFAGHEMVLGGDYMTGRLEADYLPGTMTQQKSAIFVNDTFDLGRITFTAGLRYDDLETAASFWSPSLGAVYPLGGHLLLRAYVGRGFASPTVSSAVTNEAMDYQGNPDLRVEKVLSYQGGIEGDIPSLFWYKITLFRHDVEDGITNETVDDAGTWTFVNKDKVRRQGVEIDARSVAFHGIALEGGATLTDAENRTSGNEDFWFADSTYRIGLSYTGGRGLRVLLNVHNTHWETPSRLTPEADPVADLHFSQEIAVAGLTLDLFGSAHNLFDSDQFLSASYPNPGRWLEAGLRLKF